MDAHKLVTDKSVVEAMLRCLWRDEARRLGFDERTIERLTFLRWRLERRGGAAKVAVEPVARR